MRLMTASWIRVRADEPHRPLSRARRPPHRPRGGGRAPRGDSAARGALRRLPVEAAPRAAGGSREPRHRAALGPPGRGAAPRAGGRGHRRRHADRLGQDALLQPAGARRLRRRSPRRGRSISSRSRRSSRTSSARSGSWPRPAASRGASPPRSTTATPRRTGARRSAPAAERRDLQPGHAPRRGARLPPEVGDLLHEPEVRRPRRGPHLPRGLRLATSPTCCGGCCASRSTTAPGRRSSPARRPSPTRGSWRRGSPGASRR